MSDSYRTTRARIDSDAFARLMEVGKKADLYDSRNEAREDNFEAVIHLLADRFEAEPKALREDVSVKYDGGEA